MLAEFLSFNAFAVLLVFARWGSALMVVPGFSGGQVSPRIRLLIAFTISLLLSPVLAGRFPELPASPATLTLLIGSECIIGLFFGILTRVLLAAVHTAGTMASLFASLANAMVHDTVSDQQASTIAGFLSTVAVLMIFATNLHHVVLEAIIATYDVFPVGNPLPVGDFAEIMSRTVARSFALGLQMAAPFLIISFTYSVGLGLLGRLMPQLPVFFFGLPVQISLQLWALMLTLSAVMLAFIAGFAEGIAVLVTL